MATNYPLTVDYGLSVKAAVKAGHYDWADNSTTIENFPTKKKGKKQVVVELIHLNRFVSTDEVLRELDKMGMRPADIREGLALGETHPDIQREFPVVILGSVWQDSRDGRYVPCLRGHGSERHLNLLWVEQDWSEVCRFAAVRK